MHCKVICFESVIILGMCMKKYDGELKIVKLINGNRSSIQKLTVTSKIPPVTL